MMSAPSLTDIPTPEQPGRPQLSMNNKRAQLDWQPVETSTMYAVERKRSGDDDKMWLEIANTDRTSFIDRSVSMAGTYSYRVVAKFLKVNYFNI
jgi:fibronectin type 3 domain-containing protein